MKNILLLFVLFGIMACKKEAEVAAPTTCLQDKFERFKMLSWAYEIVQIDYPDGPKYWFVDSIVDGGEDIIDTDCKVICIVDCECTEIVPCLDQLFDYPRKTIWRK